MHKERQQTQNELGDWTLLAFSIYCKIQAHACRDQTLEQQVVGMLQTSNSISYKWGGFAPVTTSATSVPS